jgi:hypothetical protein
MLLDILKQPEIFLNKGLVVKAEVGKSHFTWSLQIKNLIHHGVECNMLIIRDITHLKELSDVRNQNQALSMLTATISHEMLMPIMCIIMFVNECLKIKVL